MSQTIFDLREWKFNEINQKSKWKERILKYDQDVKIIEYFWIEIRVFSRKREMFRRMFQQMFQKLFSLTPTTSPRIWLFPLSVGQEGNIRFWTPLFSTHSITRVSIFSVCFIHTFLASPMYRFTFFPQPRDRLFSLWHQLNLYWCHVSRGWQFTNETKR